MYTVHRIRQINQLLKVAYKNKTACILRNSIVQVVLHLCVSVRMNMVKLLIKYSLSVKEI